MRAPQPPRAAPHSTAPHSTAHLSQESDPQPPAPPFTQPPRSPDPRPRRARTPLALGTPQPRCPLDPRVTPTHARCQPQHRRPPRAPCPHLHLTPTVPLVSAPAPTAGRPCPVPCLSVRANSPRCRRRGSRRSMRPRSAERCRGSQGAAQGWGLGAPPPRRAPRHGHRDRGRQSPGGRLWLVPSAGCERGRAEDGTEGGIHISPSLRRCLPGAGALSAYLSGVIPLEWHRPISSPTEPRHPLPR
ncbi:uncharacterized protein LOC136019569 [Lathamus discolor]|uniref:uncharacterized protein LOC136019569 n=1 Tax=Lathamus discolor TaxID=678569 RepID=UPI0032B80734